MSTITHRVGLSRNLTAAEVDANFDSVVADVTANTTNISNLTTAVNAAGGNIVQNGGTSITVVAATHNGNILSTTSATAVSLVLNTGVALSRGMSVEQVGAGTVTLSGTATFIAPNGLSTNGIGSIMSIVPTGNSNEYMVLVKQISDSTLINAAAGATPAVNMALYNVVDLTLTANCTPVFSGAVSGQAYAVELILRQDGTGGRTLTLPTTKWSGGVAPTYITTAGAINIITLQTVNGGTSYFGFVGGLGMA